MKVTRYKLIQTVCQQNSKSNLIIADNSDSQTVQQQQQQQFI